MNGALLKRLKRRLAEGVAQFVKEDVGDVSRAHALQKAYALWLEEPLLQEASLYLPALPPQYEPRLLATILHADHAPWLEALHRDGLLRERDENISSWLELCCRKPSNKTANFAGKVCPEIYRTDSEFEPYNSPGHQVAYLKR